MTSPPDSPDCNTRSRKFAETLSIIVSYQSVGKCTCLHVHGWHVTSSNSANNQIVVTEKKKRKNRVLQNVRVQQLGHHNGLCWDVSACHANTCFFSFFFFSNRRKRMSQIYARCMLTSAYSVCCRCCFERALAASFLGMNLTT